MKNKILVPILTFALTLCSSFSVYGQLGQNLTIGNAKALSLANAVTADPPGPDSLHFNPAGIYRAIEMTAHGEHNANRMFEFQLIHAPDPDIEFSSQWTGEYPESGLIVDNCDASCFLTNDETLDKRTSKVEDFQTYVPFSGPSEANAFAPKAGFVYKGSNFAFGNGTYVTAATGYSLPAGSVGEYPRREGAVVNFVMSAPGFAFKLTDSLTVGISFPLNYSGLALNTTLRLPNLYVGLLSETVSTLCTSPLNADLCLNDDSSLPTYEGLLEVNLDLEDSLTPSFNLGFLWEASPWLTFGGVYQGEVKHKMKGTFEVLYDESMLVLLETGIVDVIPNTPNADVDENYVESGKAVVEQTLPAHISLGVSAKVLPNLKVNIDYKKTFFSQWKELVIQYDSATYISAFTSLLSGAEENTTITPLGFETGDNIATGIEYQYNQNLALRLGYEFRKTVIPAENRTFAYPIGDTRVWGLGAAYKLPKGRLAQFAYSNIRSHQNIPSGTSYANTWDATELYAAYPGYNLGTKLETNIFVFSLAAPW